jgi:hypothetical protein
MIEGYCELRQQLKECFPTNDVRTTYWWHFVRCVTNGYADNMSGTSEVPQGTDPLCATRKSAEVGQGEPDMQISRIRLSDKTSRLCPRHVATERGGGAVP